MFLTYLFTPADNARKIEKAFASEADAVILDLEDGVALSQKEAARRVLRETVRSLRKDELLRKPFYIRCNQAGSTYFADDLSLAKDVLPFGVMLPKFESSKEVEAVAQVLGEVEILPLIESVAGIRHLQQSTSLPPQVKRFAFGAVDYALDLGADWSTSGEERRFAMGQLVFLSRALQLESPIDAVFPVLDNPVAFDADVKLGKQMGFYGKMIIHPAQIAGVCRAYQVTDAEYSWAQRVVEKYESTTEIGAFELEGKMVDLPVYLKAKKVLGLRLPR